MGKTAIITCFGYPGNYKYAFDPRNVRADLRRVLTFALNRVGMNPENVIVLTDFSPDPDIVRDILREYRNEILLYLYDLGYKARIPEVTRVNDLEEVYNLVRLAAPSLNLTFEQLLEKIVSRIIPRLKTETVLEYASLFMNFRLVSGMDDYFDQISKALGRLRSSDQVLFYYTGHGVRLMNGGRLESLALIISNRKMIGQYLKVDILQNLFDRIPSNVDGLVVFDCCHASGMLNLPRNSGLIVLASCRENQTCGFYEDDRSGKYGSLFTYYLISALNKGRRNIRHITSEIEKEINSYRSQKGKPAQNVSIQSGMSSVIPEWK